MVFQLLKPNVRPLLTSWSFVRLASFLFFPNWGGKEFSKSSSLQIEYQLIIQSLKNSRTNNRTFSYSINYPTMGKKGKRSKRKTVTAADRGKLQLCKANLFWKTCEVTSIRFTTTWSYTSINLWLANSTWRIKWKI